MEVCHNAKMAHVIKKQGYVLNHYLKKKYLKYQTLKYVMIVKKLILKQGDVL
jgi:hypothetical protein